MSINVNEFSSKDKRFDSKKVTMCTLIRMYLESEGYEVFATNYDFDSNEWIFGVEIREKCYDAYVTVELTNIKMRLEVR